MNESKPTATRRISIAEAMEAHRVVRATNAALRPHGLNVSLLGVLASFADGADQRITRVARSLGIQRAVMSEYLGQLELRRLVTRTTKGGGGRFADRRRVTVAVTERGRQLLTVLAEIEIEGEP